MSSTALIYLLAVILQGPAPVPRQATVPPTNGGSTIQPQSKDQKKPTIPEGNKDYTAGNQDKGNQQKDSEYDIPVRISKPLDVTKDWRDKLNWIFTCALVVIGATGVGAAIWTVFWLKTQVRIERITMKANLRAARAASINAKAALRELQISADRERPRIAVTPSPLRLGGLNDMHVVAYIVDCLCPTSAFIVDAKAEAYCEEFLSTIPMLPITLPSRIDKTEKFHLWQLIFGLTEEIIEDINAGKRNLFFCGFIEYRGIHLREAEPSYNTSFKYKWTAPDVLGGGGWEPTREADNQQT